MSNKDELQSKYNIINRLANSNHKLKCIIELCETVLPSHYSEFEFLGHEIVKLSNLLGNHIGLATGYKYLGIVSKANRHLKESIEYFTKASEALMHSEDPILKAAILNNLGNIHKDLNEYQKAIFYYFEAYKISEKYTASRSLPSVLNNIANIYVELEDFENALVSYLKAEQLFANLSREADLAIVNKNIAYLHYHLNNYTAAIEYYNKSIELATKIDYPYLLSKCYLGKSDIYIAQNNYDVAVTFLNESLRISNKLDNQGRTINIKAYLTFGKLYSLKQDHDLTEQFFLKALEIGLSNNFRSDLIAIHSSLSKLYRETNRYEKAFHHLSEYLKLKDELFQKDTMNKIRNMQVTQQLEQITREKEFAEQQAKAKANFLADMSHEIRTPMNHIIGFSELLESSNLQEEDRFNLGAIRQAADHLLNVINEILDYSKIEAGQIELKKEVFNIQDEIKKILQMFAISAQKKSLQLTHNIDSRIPKSIIGDSYRLYQILYNILGNSFKFTEKGYVRLVLKLLEQRENTMTIQFQITDTGIGMNKTKLNRIFDKYKQIDNGTFYTYGGTGLGLSISKQLVELQGGKIFVDSEEGVGTTFNINIPFEISEGDILGGNSSISILEPEIVYDRLNILLAEDNSFNQMLAVKVLKKYFPQSFIEVVENGEKAIDMLNRYEFSVIIMDCKMPEMDGFETTRYIRGHTETDYCNIPILAFSAGVTKGEVDEAIAAGMDDFLSKPFKAHELVEKVKKVTKLRKGGTRLD